jgi:hypothetical protein
LQSRFRCPGLTTINRWLSTTKTPAAFTRNDQALAQYALYGLPNQVMAAEYKLALPDEATLVDELEKTQRQFARTHKPPEKLPAPKAKKKAAAKRKPTAKTKRKT